MLNLAVRFQCARIFASNHLCLHSLDDNFAYLFGSLCHIIQAFRHVIYVIYSLALLSIIVIVISHHVLSHL